MITTMLFILKYALITFFGIIVSITFTGVRMNGRMLGVVLLLFAVCGSAELCTYSIWDYETTHRFYPLIVHLPILLVLIFHYRKRIVTSIAAITTAYLLCQPAKWFSLFFESITKSENVEIITYIIILAAIGVISLWHIRPCVEEMYNKDARSVLIFGSIPFAYYIFDYTIISYKQLLISHTQLIMEFLPFIMCLSFTLFCIVYFQEYEKNADTERRNQLIRIAAEQQEKEIEAIRKINMETHVIRHDLRFLLSTLAASIENDDKETTKKLLSDYTELVETTFVKRYCKNDIINYILINFASKCKEASVEFDAQIELGDLDHLGKDELLFASIVSNSLDNAYNAQLSLPPEMRRVETMIKTSRDKLLVSVKNPFASEPKFVNGMPVSRRKGHGYGTQGIRYLTERLDGNCQFSIQDGMFVTRIII